MFRRSVHDLIGFWKERSEFKAPEKKRRKLFDKTWSMFKVPEADIERLRSLSSSGTRLEALVSSEGWNDVLDAKMYYQSLYDLMTKDPNRKDQDRFRAACEWSAIEGLFREISNRIRRGKEAREKLSKLF